MCHSRHYGAFLLLVHTIQLQKALPTRVYQTPLSAQSVYKNDLENIVSGHIVGYLRLRGGSDPNGAKASHDTENHGKVKDTALQEDEGVRMYRCVPGGDLELEPSCSLRTPDQDNGVDYGAYGFMFDIRALKKKVIITGMQICSADGSPRDYKVRTFKGTWRDAWKDPSLWTVCGGGNRVYVPDHGHGDYGPLPWTAEGVEIEAGTTRAFYVHGNNDEVCVAYRLVGHTRTYPGHRLQGASEIEAFVTDQDDWIALISGRKVGEPDPFPDSGELGGHALDAFVRGFLGIVEYEVA